MSNEKQRSYNCKDEELPMIGQLLFLSFQRDLAEFSAFSPKFGESYVADIEAKLTTVSELVEPKAETLAKKLITTQLYEIIDGLLQPINSLSAYLSLAKVLKISTAEFGLTALRKACIKHDVEGVLNDINFVLVNVNAHKTILVAQGLKEELITVLSTSAGTLTNLKKEQYSLLTNRKSIVQDNLLVLNGYYNQLTEICTVGKALYKSINPAKVKEYTFTEIKKQVSRATKTKVIPSVTKAVVTPAS